ncbi:hypothetical protein TSOC_000315 [Tetrabaena socialis]|uniref:Reverse transcriptase domain-containing protein n=1 Tax=Tetrabaena socialis TaxID=47790 RepID=A0A2J8AJP1_9CHLO|nr:hypothetical protein TSOC_000315 [Tetrabaena socialis]|eukprot:PNH12737.1 hypothetical protein TSOC_000315 [Tetrabaena socialis]
MTKLPCPLPDLVTILQHLHANGFLGERDLASVFHHVKLCQAARRFAAFRHPMSNALQRWVGLPFGASQSPLIFVELTTAACAIFQAECDSRGLHVRVYVYVDDIMLLGRTHADVRGAFAVLDEVGEELGFEWKLSKDRGRDVALQQLEMLGLLFDTVRQELRMSPDKRTAYAAAIAALLATAAADQPVTRTALQTVVGKLSFITRACRWGATFLQSLHDSLVTVQPGASSTIRLQPGVIDDLRSWHSLLRADSSVRDGVKCCAVADIDLVRGAFRGPEGAVIFTDASGRGWWAEVVGGWTPDEQSLHVARLELTAVLHALQTWAPSLAHPGPPAAASQRCAACDRLVGPAYGWWGRRCETCPCFGHRNWLGVAASAYPGGWYSCTACLLLEAGLGQGAVDPYVSILAARAVGLTGSAVGEGSAATYESHRRRFQNLCTGVLGLGSEAAFPRERGADLNRAVVCLFLAHAASRYAASTVDGTLSALGDWQRPPAAASQRCAACDRLVGPAYGWWGRRCETCPCFGHRNWLGVAASAYPGGWYSCTACLLLEAGLGQGAVDPYVSILAARAVGLTGSAVGEGSAATYESHRRRFQNLCTGVLGLGSEAAFPRERGADLNRAVVCLFLAHAASRYAASTVDGTLSALGDWQRSRGIPAA